MEPAHVAEIELLETSLRIITTEPRTGHHACDDLPHHLVLTGLAVDMEFQPDQSRSLRDLHVRDVAGRNAQSQ